MRRARAACSPARVDVVRTWEDAVMPTAKITTTRSCFKGPIAKRDEANATPQSMRPKLSGIVPLYNEQESVAPLYRAIVSALTPLNCTFEMVFVDDGSADRTVAIATGLAKTDSRLRIVRFRRNYGQTAAMAARTDYARGDILAAMARDLQTDPADIGAL